MSRFTLANLLILIGLIAVELGALRSGTDFAARLAFTLMLAALAVGLLGALVRRNNGSWIGFALFGWGFAVMVFVPAIHKEVVPHLLGTEPLDRLIGQLYPFQPEPAFPILNAQFMNQMGSKENLQFNLQAFNGPSNVNRVLLSTNENKAFDDYIAQYQLYSARRRAIYRTQANSRRVGLSLLTLISALAGAVLGRFLGDRRGQNAIL